MKILVLFFLLIVSSCSTFQRGPSYSGVSILQLATTETATEFNVLLAKDVIPKFVVTTPSGETVAPTGEIKKEQEGSNWAMHHVKFTNLPSNATGDFRFIVQSAQGSVIDQRQFKLFANTGEGLRFVIGACADVRQISKSPPVWEEVFKANPEWIFLVGDNVYATQSDQVITEPGLLWKRYAETRLALPLYYSKQLIPTHAIWDDNDYGASDGGTEYVLKERASEIFRDFFLPAFDSEIVQKGPGVSSRLTLRGMHFHFLDNRTYRDVSPEGEHFGVEQEQWLFKDLKEAQLPSWIISGDQFFGAYHQFDSYEGKHPRAFEAFLGNLRQVTTPFVLVSGDRHLAEVQQFPRALLGQLSFEFTSGPLHGNLYPAGSTPLPNPWRVVVRDDAFNFYVVDTKLAENSWDINLKAQSPGAVLFSRDFSLTTEALKDFTIEKRQKRRKYRRSSLRRR